MLINEDFVQKIIEKEINNSGLFITMIQIKNSENIKVFIDSDKNVTIDDCSRINLLLYKALEELGLNYAIEVSSHGLNQKFVDIRQYKKNIGRDVEVITKNGQKEIGKLIKAEADFFEIEQTNPKHNSKKNPGEIKVKKFLYTDCKSVKIHINF